MGKKVSRKSAPTSQVIGRRMFGDYQVDKVLGEGGMGAVYLARHTTIEQVVAIKVLHASSAEDTELVKRFNREAKAIARLSHPNIIRVFIFGHTDDGMIYMVMEYVDGPSLREVLEHLTRLSELRAIYILKQVLAALSEAHHLGIVHRDLKPDNILLTEYRGNTDFVKVVDFGIAKVREPEGVEQEKLTQAGVVYGTPEYLSPEQAQAIEADGRADLYALGVILWEMVTGDVPFAGDTAMSVLVGHVYEPLPDPRRFNPDLSDGMVNVLTKALQKDPRDRFQTADEFLTAISRLENRLRREQLKKGELVYDSRTKTAVWAPPQELVEQAAYLDSSDFPTLEPIPSRHERTPTRQFGPPQEGEGSVARRAVIMAIVVGLVLLVIMAVALVVLMLGRP